VKKGLIFCFLVAICIGFDELCEFDFFFWVDEVVLLTVLLFVLIQPVKIAS
jgi:hypothetical protein